MANVWAYSLISVVIVSLLSFIGLLTFSMHPKRLKKILIYMVSFSAGALFGDAFFHLLPESTLDGMAFRVSLSVMSGIVLSFIVEKVIFWRHCHLPTTKEHPHPFAIMNLVGDSVHNFIDGIIIGASYIAGIEVGIATTLAVVLHEIPQEIGDFGILLYGGFSKSKALMYNFLTAITAVAGAVLALVLSRSVEGVTTFLIPFSAGTFIYIAGSDLIPELHKEANTKKSLLEIGTFCAGVLVMIALLLTG
ncbi:MAG TPA: ZIP family metal transporter [Candidatus Nanoarchaeia archaeon]|nr:ZIP family metal transporter [Candidatus Nanoarchaeia archaeon]